MCVFHPQYCILYCVVVKLNLTVKSASKENTKLTRMNIVQKIVGLGSFARSSNVYMDVYVKQIIKT